MLFDKWDVDHIAIAVTDLDAAMKEYSEALEIEWGDVAEFSAEDATLYGSDTGASIEGLSAVDARPPAGRKPESGPPVLLELVHAPPSSPAFAVWGCPDGRDYVHHVAYLALDVSSESARLLDLGFTRDWYAEDESGRIVEAYHQSPTGVRIQLVPTPKNAPNHKSVLPAEGAVSAVNTTDK